MPEQGLFQPGGTGGTSGGSSPAGVGDYAYFGHTGSPNPDSSSFDFSVGTVDGTSIDVDNSTEWVSGSVSWGYAVPRFVVAGLYSIGLGVYDSEALAYTLQFLDAAGNPLDNVFAAPETVTVRQAAGVDDGSGAFRGLVWITTHLPAGAHLNVAPSVPSSAPTMWLLIEKVG